jgi:chorismate mutase/prephenate dehydratase
MSAPTTPSDSTNGISPLQSNEQAPQRPPPTDAGSAAERLAAIDSQILGWIATRMALLKEWQKSATPLPSLRETVQSVRDPIQLPSDSPTPPPAQRETLSSLLVYVAGATYDSVVGSSQIAYLGPEHSYSYLAAAKFFGGNSSLQAVRTIGAVFEEVVREQARYGVVPIENSTDGRIADTLTMFIRMPVRICGEVLLPIHHHLLAQCDRSQVETVYSKPQALSQCRAWLQEHLPNARWVEVASTTAAAKIAATEPRAAAVASLDAAIHHGLNVLAHSIEDNPNNATRFAIIGKEHPSPSDNDKTTLLFQVPHKPGALADVMILFKSHGLNLTWIESFPVPGVANEYFFLVELDGHEAHANLQSMIATLRRDALRLDVLGSYPKATA